MFFFPGNYLELNDFHFLLLILLLFALLVFIYSTVFLYISMCSFFSFHILLLAFNIIVVVIDAWIPIISKTIYHFFLCYCLALIIIRWKSFFIYVLCIAILINRKYSIIVRMPCLICARFIFYFAHVSFSFW